MFINTIFFMFFYILNKHYKTTNTGYIGQTEQHLYQATYLFSAKKCIEPWNEYEVCSRFLKRDPCMLNGHCFKIARQMYRSFCEQQNLHWRSCIELTRMKNSTAFFCESTPAFKHSTTLIDLHSDLVRSIGFRQGLCRYCCKLLVLLMWCFIV